MLNGLRKIISQSMAMAPTAQDLDGPLGNQTGSATYSFQSASASIFPSQNPPPRGPANNKLFSAFFSVVSSLHPASPEPAPWLVEKAQAMAAQSKAWGFDLRSDNRFHYLMAVMKDKGHSDVEIRKVYEWVTLVRDRLLSKIEEIRSQGKDPLPQNVLEEIYYIIEKEGQIQYSPTNDFIDGLLSGELDCDTESFLVLGVTDEIGLPVEGVRAPQHFFVRWDDGQGTQFNMDIYGTSILNEDYIDGSYGGGSPIDPISIAKGNFLSPLKGSQLISDYIVNAGLKDMDYLNEAIRLDPASSNAWLRRAYVYQENGEFQKALENFSHAISLFPNNIDTYIYRGLLNAQLENLEKFKGFFANHEAVRRFREAAIEDLKMAYSLMPEVEWHDLIQTGNLQSPEVWLEKIAERSLELAVTDIQSRDTGLQMYLTGLSIYFPHSDEFLGKIARKSFNPVIQYEWNRGLDLQDHLVRIKNIFPRLRPDAQAKMLAKLQQAPFRPAVRQVLADAYLELGNYEATIGAYEEVLSLEGDNIEVRGQLGLMYSYAGNMEAARAMFEEILKQDPRNIKALLKIFPNPYQHPQEAKTLSEKILALDPANESALTWQADADTVLGNYKQALSAYLDILAKNPDNPEMLNAVGWAWFWLENYEMAETYACAILQENPEDLYAKDLLAWAYLKKGKIDLADSIFQEVLSRNYQKRSRETLDPSQYTDDDRNSLEGLGMIHAHKGEYNKALLYLEAAHRLAPWDADLQKELKEVRSRLD